MRPFHFVSKPPRETNGIVFPPGIESKNGLLGFLARSIPLPDYFGQNWDALEESLGDLDWLDRPKIVLIHHDIPLQNAPADQRIYLEILADAAKNSERLEIIFPESCRAQVNRILSLA